MESVRVAELVTTLSYAADLGLGQPLSHCMRQTVIALRLADLADAPAEDRAATYYTGLLMNTYCHADATEQARWFGDEIRFKSDTYGLLGKRRLHGGLSFVGWPVMVARGRVRRVASAQSGYREMVGFLKTHSTLGSQFAARIGLGERVAAAVSDTYEQWDGKGEPNQGRGKDIGLRPGSQFAGPIEVYARQHGAAARSPRP